MVSLKESVDDGAIDVDFGVDNGKHLPFVLSSQLQTEIIHMLNVQIQRLIMKILS